MSMTEKLWSLNALATEMDYDRRTAAAALQKVRPDGHLSGKPAWRLDTALAVLKPKPKSDRFEPRFPEIYQSNTDQCAEFVNNLTVMAVMEMVYRAPAHAATLAVRGGVDMASAYRLRHDVTLAMMSAAQDALRGWNVRPFSDGVEMDWPLDACLQNDWEALA